MPTAKMKIFLSCAKENGEVASIIADRLNEHFDIFYWQDPGQRGGWFFRQLEQEINAADAFLALLSPSFLRSYWCGQERGLALQREAALQATDTRASFIHVANVTDMSPVEAGFLSAYSWLDMTSPDKRESALPRLVDRLRAAGHPGSSATAAGSSSQSSPPGNAEDELVPGAPRDELVFRNREDELEKVLRGLTNSGGPHFWLVVAPPQLGKTWFLERVSADRALSEPVPWVVRLADLRSQPPDVRGDAAALLALLFGRSSPAPIGQDTFLSIAQEILRSGQPHLCLLDNAELLDEETAGTLRECLSQIYRLVHDRGRRNLRLAFIVASRRDDEWKGVTPAPRLSPLALTEFNPVVVQQALHDLSAEMDTSFTPAQFRNYATRVHHLTEGLPALLVRCLQWIRAEEWLGMDRLETQELFEALTDPYIRQDLLAQMSLLPAGQERAGERLHALEEAFRVLAPYRLFTHSHLNHHLEIDPDFRSALGAAGWSMADLWAAINETALLRRPLNEPWQEISAAIRRLLYRYFYRSDEQRAEAHTEARRFVEIWADKQAGTEQVVGLVECLWHEAIVLGLRRPAEMEQSLTESARALSGGLEPSPAFTLSELRAFATQRMRNDEELQEAVGGVGGLFSRLVEVVARP